MIKALFNYLEAIPIRDEDRHSKGFLLFSIRPSVTFAVKSYIHLSLSEKEMKEYPKIEALSEVYYNHVVEKNWGK